MAGLCPNVRMAVYEKYRNKDTPGPVYDYGDSIGKQSSSRKATAAAFSFGSASRDKTTGNPLSTCCFDEFYVSLLYMCSLVCFCCD